MKTLTGSKKALLLLFVGCLVAVGGVSAFAMDSDSSDAASSYDYSWQSGKSMDVIIWQTLSSYLDLSEPLNIPGLSYNVELKETFLNLRDERYLHITGTPNTPGEYTIKFKSWTFLGTTEYFSVTVLVYTVTEYVNITYSAGIGTVKGASSWTETIVKGTNASLPTAVYSTGAYSFKGWATSSTSSSVVSTYVGNSNATLYAVWVQNAVTISGDSNVTAVQSQAFSQVYSTNPSSATMSITNYGGLTGQVSLSGKTLSGNISANPGTYTITLSASSSGYITGTLQVKITVPIVIVPPIEYTQAINTVWSYEPVTNPSNASISITSVKFNGSTISGHGLSVVGRTITGTLTNQGTYSVQFTASATGYSSVSKTVLVYTYVPASVPDPPAIGSISAVERVGEPRTYDFVALGVANATQIAWFVDNVEFASSSNTAVYQFPAAGVFTVKCVVKGADGSTANKTVQVVNTQSYNKDMAWVGVPYGYVHDYSGSAPSVTVSGCFTSQSVTVGSDKFIIISGTPSVHDVGSTYSVSIGSSNWSIKVYQAESVAPVSSFSYEVADDYDLSVTFTGLNASKVLWDFDDGNGWVSSTQKTYSVVGYYSVRCLAINNISERISTQSVMIAIPDEVTLSFSALQDYYGYINRPIVLSITGLAQDDVLSIGGTAAVFLSVDGNVISGTFDEVGVYSLSMSALHNDMTETTHSIVMYLTDPPEDDDDDEELSILDYWLEIILIILAFFILWGIFGRIGGKK